jgi:hypothetical protein
VKCNVLDSGGYRRTVGSVVAAGLVWWFGGDVLGGLWGPGAAQARSGKRVVAKRMVIPPRPKLGFRKDRVCRRDSDCVLRPTVCQRCAPCKPAWRSVCNRKTARRIRATRNRVRCALPRCRKCSRSSNWLGTRPVCFKKQCVIAPLQKKQRKTVFGASDLQCKRNRDCGFRHAPLCACRPCGLYWRQPANRRSIRREMRRRSRMGACRTSRCKPCTRRALGKKSLCIAGRCTVRAPRRVRKGFP